MVNQQFTAHFDALQFAQRSDGGTLTPAQIEKARRLANPLEAARRALGFAICITAYVQRLGHVAHGDGDSVDVAPCDGDEAKVVQLHTWLATYKTSEFGKLILETSPSHPGRWDHVHMTLPGFQGVTGQVLVEAITADGPPSEGSYTLASIAPAGAAVIGPFVLLWFVWRLLTRRPRRRV